MVLKVTLVSLSSLQCSRTVFMAYKNHTVPKEKLNVHCTHLIPSACEIAVKGST